MPRPKRVLPYLQKRPSGWYFRYRLPSEIQLVAELSEIRISLGTKNYACARERVEQAYPYVLTLKRLKRMSKELTPEVVQQVLNQVFTQLVNKLEKSRLPWNQELNLSSMMGAENPVNQLMAGRHEVKITELSAAIKRREIGKAKPAARARLKRLGADFSESSPEFKALCLDILKLETTYWEAEKHRARGNFEHEVVLLDHFRKKGYTELVDRNSSISISHAWSEYYNEKATNGPSSDWSQRTAKGQTATFEEFLEIVGDAPIEGLTRDTMLRYLDSVAKVPKNRTKKYGKTPIAELLEMELEADELPSQRTVAEKLTQIRAFLKWCRGRGYSETDPTSAIKVKADSRSYAVFTKADLSRMFENDVYRDNRHRKSWQFWIPLIALYTGARQNELAQLKTIDIQHEDGTWIIVVTDFGDDQRVKTKAAIRKVPIHPILLEHGLHDYATALRENGGNRLFPDLVKGTNSWGQKVSRWFGDTYKPKCGIENDLTGSRKVFHSFRHTAITQALSSGQPLTHCQQVFGHEKSMLGETATYIHQFSPGQLTGVIASLDYGLDHYISPKDWFKWIS